MGIFALAAPFALWERSTISSRRVQQKLARAPMHGFFIIHLRDGKAAFAEPP